MVRTENFGGSLFNHSPPETTSWIVGSCSTEHSNPLTNFYLLEPMNKKKIKNYQKKSPLLTEVSKGERSGHLRCASGSSRGKNSVFRSKK